MLSSSTKNHLFLLYRKYLLVSREEKGEGGESGSQNSVCSIEPQLIWMESLICVYNAPPPVPPASRETHWDCENESFQMLNKLPRIQTEPGPHHLVKTHSLGELQVNCSVLARPGRPKYKLLQFYTERNLRNVGPGANSVNNRDYTLTAETETASPTPFTSLL